MYSYSPFDFQDYDYLSALFCHNNFENDNNSLNTPLILSPANNVSENVLQSPSTCLNLFEPIATPISQTIGTVGPSLASRSMKSSPYPPIRMIGSIAEHDRPYAVYGQLSMNELFFKANTFMVNLGHARIARQCCFDLTGFKTKRRRLFDNKRMSRQTYAIMCTTSITSKKTNLNYNYFIISFYRRTCHVRNLSSISNGNPSICMRIYRRISIARNTLHYVYTNNFKKSNK